VFVDDVHATNSLSGVDLPTGKKSATIRPYQTILVPNRIPGNAYWKDVVIG
jgi:hypothetical protein